MLVGYRCLKALKGELIDMLKDRLLVGVLKFYYSIYRNGWFLVKKKSGKHRLINNA